MRACWTLPTPDPASGSFSQKQPPACESSQKLAASPDQLCSFDHQLCGIRSIFHTSAGVAATCAVCATVKPISRWSMTLAVAATRSEEHTSELQSLMRTSYAVFCLKKKI